VRLVILRTTRSVPSSPHILVLSFAILLAAAVPQAAAFQQPVHSQQPAASAHAPAPGRAHEALDTAYARLGLPFVPAFWIVATVISVSAGYAVADCGLKALGMDHGNPSIDDAQVLFCSDEHITFVPPQPIAVGARIRIWPAHIDPTVAYHERLHVVRDERVLEVWPVDLRGW